jgi:hypothetical protein
MHSSDSKSKGSDRGVIKIGFSLQGSRPAPATVGGGSGGSGMIAWLDDAQAKAHKPPNSKLVEHLEFLNIIVSEKLKTNESMYPNQLILIQHLSGRTTTKSAKTHC